MRLEEWPGLNASWPGKDAMPWMWGVLPTQRLNKRSGKRAKHDVAASSEYGCVTVTEGAIHLSGVESHGRTHAQASQLMLGEALMKVQLQ